MSVVRELRCCIFPKVVMCRRICFIAKVWAIDHFNDTSHISVVFVNFRRALSVSLWSLDNLPFEERGKPLKGSGGLGERVVT